MTAVGSLTQEPMEEIHILWLTAGLSCDGDTVAATAARLPSTEDIVLGAIPAIPRVKLHNPVLAAEWGDDFIQNYDLSGG
jgi:hydrogenase small subunit